MIRKIIYVNITATSIVHLQIGSEVLHVEETKKPGINLNILVDPEEEQFEEREFELLTGNDTIDWTRNITYIGSAARHHVFEILKPISPKPSHK